MAKVLIVLIILISVFINGCFFIQPDSSSTSPSNPDVTIESPAVPTIKEPEVISPIQKSTTLVEKHYEYLYGPNQWTWDLHIPQSLYDYYRTAPRPPTPNYSVYITHPWDDEYTDILVSKFNRIANEEGFSELQKIEFTAAFVQNLKYTADSVTTPYDEYPRYPLETLVDEGGDCEDTSILLASLINRMGYGVVLIIFPDKHCAVGVSGGQGIHGTYFVHNGAKYYYLETTAPGWGLGMVPEEFQSEKAILYDMAPTPILTHSWEGRQKAKIVELTVTVENLGTLAADEVYIYAGFDAGDNKLWNPQESGVFKLPINQQVDISMTIQSPEGIHTRVVVQVIYDGYAISESFSDWFDT